MSLRRHLEALRLFSSAGQCEYHWPRLKLIRIFLTVLLLASPAVAEPSVLLVVQGGIDQDPAPCELRLRSELASEGLEVVTASSQARQSLLDLEGLARRTGAVAGLSVLVDVQSIDGRLWVTDPSSRADLVRTLHVSRTEADPVSVFALRALEALRGARLELETQRRRLSSAAQSSAEPPTAAPVAATGASSAPPSAVSVAPIVPVPTKTKEPAASTTNLPKPPVEAVDPADAGTRPVDSHPWLLQVHGVVGQELNSVGLVVGPGLALRRIVYSRLFAGVVVDGPLFSKMEPKAGTVVHVNQELFASEVRWVPIAHKIVSFEVLGTTGLSRFAVRGEAQQPNGQGVSNHAFGWTIGAGLGLGVQLSKVFSLGIDAQWLRRLPAPVILDKTRRLTGDTDSLLVSRVGLGALF